MSSAVIRNPHDAGSRASAHHHLAMANTKDANAVSSRNYLHGSGRRHHPLDDLVVLLRAARARTAPHTPQAGEGGNPEPNAPKTLNPDPETHSWLMYMLQGLKSPPSPVRYASPPPSVGPGGTLWDPGGAGGAGGAPLSSGPAGGAAGTVGAAGS